MSLKLTEAQEQRLLDIEEAHDGDLQANFVVEDAADASSPLHKLIEWNDAKAGPKYRIIQARAIIGARVYHKSGTVGEPTRVYARNPLKPAHEQGYTRLTSLKLNPAAARQTIRVEVARVESALKRCIEVADVVGGTDIVNDLLVRLKDLELLAVESDESVVDALPLDQHPDL